MSVNVSGSGTCRSGCQAADSTPDFGGRLRRGSLERAAGMRSNAAPLAGTAIRGFISPQERFLRIDTQLHLSAAECKYFCQASTVATRSSSAPANALPAHSSVAGASRRLTRHSGSVFQERRCAASAGGPENALYSTPAGSGYAVRCRLARFLPTFRRHALADNAGTSSGVDRNRWRWRARASGGPRAL